MFHGLLPDSAIVGTAGKVRHYAHGTRRHGGRKAKPMSLGQVFVTYAKDSRKAKARKARAR